MSAIDLTDLRDFALVAEHGGFGVASRLSGRSKATLSRHIAALEVSLQTRLFERSDLGMILTSSGAELLARIAGPFKEIDAAADAVRHRGDTLRGPLRISAAALFAHHPLARIGAGFSLLYPGIALEIVADDGMADLVEDAFDVVIRANPAANERLVGRCIMRTDRHAVAAPGMAIPEIGQPARLIYRCGERPEASWQLTDSAHKFALPLAPALQMSTLMMIREAAILGPGVALLPHSLVEEDLLAGRLQSWGVVPDAQTEIWILHTSRRLTQEKVTAFIAYLLASLSESIVTNTLA